jgi:hypothetical protein
MADASMSRGQTEAVAADHISEPMSMGAATRLNDFVGDSAEFSDGQAGWTRPIGHIASHAIVVVARARALRLRQAPALRK